MYTKILFRYWKIVASIIVGLVIAFAFYLGGLPFKDYLRAVLIRYPWVGLSLIGLAIFLLGSSLVYRRIIVRLGALLFALLLFSGIILNLTSFENLIQQSLVPWQRLSTNGLLAISKAYRYSRGLYMVINELYPGRKLITAPGLLTEWSIGLLTLQNWGQLEQIVTRQYDPKLSEGEVQEILAYDYSEAQLFNNGELFTYILVGGSSPGGEIILAEFDKLRFILPYHLFQRMFPGRIDQ